VYTQNRFFWIRFLTNQIFIRCDQLKNKSSGRVTYGNPCYSIGSKADSIYFLNDRSVFYFLRFIPLKTKNKKFFFCFLYIRLLYIKQEDNNVIYHFCGRCLLYISFLVPRLLLWVLLLLGLLSFYSFNTTLSSIGFFLGNVCGIRIVVLKHKPCRTCGHVQMYLLGSGRNDTDFFGKYWGRYCGGFLSRRLYSYFSLTESRQSIRKLFFFFFGVASKRSREMNA
jgi:hypothetical protein